MERKLQLNRLSRTQIRRRRIIQHEKELLSIKVTQLLENFKSEYLDNPDITRDVALAKFDIIINVKKLLDKL